MSLIYCACHAKCIFPDPLQMSHACHRFWKRFWNCYKTLTFFSLLARCRIPCAYHAKPHLNLQKWSEHVVFLTCWLQNVLRATTACTFFLHVNFQKWSENGVLCTFWLGKCASRHNGVQFFISHLPRWLCTRRFGEPTFRPSGATNPWKDTVFRDFPTFSRICICFLLTLSLLWSSLFYSPLLSASAQLCFSSVHILGSLTSKLPSVHNPHIMHPIYKSTVENRICQARSSCPWSFLPTCAARLGPPVRARVQLTHRGIPQRGIT